MCRAASLPVTITHATETRPFSNGRWSATPLIYPLSRYLSFHGLRPNVCEKLFQTLLEGAMPALIRQ